MPDYAVFAAVAAYAVVGVLLLSLNFASLWAWPVKAAAIIVTSGLFVSTYFTINALLGWPSHEQLPSRASFLSSRIVEPDKLSGDRGAIFVWLQAIDAQNLPYGEPRAFKVTYSRAVATEVIEAQRLRFQGKDVVGNFDYADVLPEPEVAPPAPGVAGARGVDTDDAARREGGGGLVSLDQDLRARFEEMPPLPLPDKTSIIDDTY